MTLGFALRSAASWSGQRRRQRTGGPADWKEDQHLPQEFINNAKERPEIASSGLVAVRTFPRDSMNIRSTRDTR